jgi:hypothetical protein
MRVCTFPEPSEEDAGNLAQGASAPLARWSSALTTEASRIGSRFMLAARRCLDRGRWIAFDDWGRLYGEAAVETVWTVEGR